MRVLLAVPSSRARLYGMVPLGWALRTAGHEVQIAGRSSFTGTITATGFVAVSVNEAIRDDPRELGGVLDYAARWRPDLVIWDAAAWGVAAVARKGGAAGVCLVGPHDHDTVPQDPGAVTLTTLPRSLRPAAHADHRPVRFVPYSGPAELPAWLGRKSRRPRVYVSRLDSAVVLGGLFEAAGGRRVEIVCAARRLPEGLRLPANVRLVDGVPEVAVLTSCAAVVHDGDPVATVTALACGLPQLALVPPRGGPVGRGLSGEGGLPGEVARLGAGLLADPARAGAEALAGHLDRLLGDPALRERAELARREIAELPSPRDVVPVLAELAADR
ncbi:nucleotide disphospho-sugar-binding domain-containing protein [Nonomuraea sp. NPDC048916]|uniref:nucleotide disphospho-sugar-binding domain-containing protein n=1 Tax=Nonomuraea sp. NPDC048916 TaxID=3154232 RepID=UPI0034027B4C